eukprot:55063-Amphidinium_carterae.1
MDALLDIKSRHFQQLLIPTTLATRNLDSSGVGKKWLIPLLGGFANGGFQTGEKQTRAIIKPTRDATLHPCGVEQAPAMVHLCETGRRRSNTDQSLCVQVNGHLKLQATRDQLGAKVTSHKAETKLN